MFEKEAEEYASRFWGKKESLDRACTIENFKEGAEFGYNKANEWHYVKDGKLDDVIDTWDKKKKYLIMARFTNNLGEHDEIPLLAYYYHHSEKWCTSKLDYLHKFYVTWWKEIELPKED